VQIAFSPRDFTEFVIGVDFSRVEWHIEIKDDRYQKVAGRKEDNWVWSPTGIIDMHRPENWGYVQFTSRTGGSFQAKRDPVTDKLLNALASVEQGQNKQAINPLSAFVNAVESALKAGKLSSETAALLTARANAIIATL
jgi:hypothetical protein